MNLKRREFLEELKKNLEVEIIERHQIYEKEKRIDFRNIILKYKLKNIDDNLINL